MKIIARPSFSLRFRNAPAADLPKFIGICPQEIRPLKLDGPASNACVGGKKPHQRSRKSTLSGSGFAEDAHDLARHEAKTDTSQGRAQSASAGAIRNMEILDFKNGLHVVDLFSSTFQFMLRLDHRANKSNMIARRPKVVLCYMTCILSSECFLIASNAYAAIVYKVDST